MARHRKVEHFDAELSARKVTESLAVRHTVAGGERGAIERDPERAPLRPNVAFIAEPLGIRTHEVRSTFVGDACADPLDKAMPQALVMAHDRSACHRPVGK